MQVSLDVGVKHTSRVARVHEAKALGTDYQLKRPDSETEYKYLSVERQKDVRTTLQLRL